MKLTGAQILMEILKEEGVNSIFGFPGGATIDIHDNLETTDIRHYLVRHEQGAVHAADGYARATGSVGVCLVTSGPGATNTVTGIATAYMDSIPLVIITGQVPTHLIGNDAFQEVDIVGITRPCTKHNYLVPSVEELPRILREAFHIARSGRPGPVLVDIPKNVQQASTTFKPKQKVTLKSYNPTYKPNSKQLRKVVGLIMAAKRPVIFAGGGVILSKGAEELTQLARSARIPVTTSLMGLGAFPGSDPLWLGMIGMHGTYRANMSTGELRSADRHRCALRRPGNRQDRHLCRPGRNRSHRYRPHLHSQERTGEHPGGGRLQDHTGSDQPLPGRRGPGQTDGQSRPLAGSN
jgi:acetolactate synthase-1/2/3 large subunit